ncbi:hypothetical protein LTR28_009527 [Elasticomyces elasticus]|nr:hypothetical protein LTR28_009527 [Elasticomyces elasticus]
MVSYKTILASNQSLKPTRPNLTAAFLGATNGIGLGALRALTAHTVSPTIYVVGRSLARLEHLFTSLRTLNPTATFVPVLVTDLTLVKDAQHAATEIARAAPTLDLLVMSPGYIGLAYDLSPEGLERCLSIRYYARTRFLLTLLPLLRAAPAARVVSVLGGGKEGPLWPDDWALRRHFGLVRASGAAGSMQTLMFEALGAREENKGVAFVHSFPGLVGGTGLAFKGLGAFGSFLVDWVLMPVVRLVGYSTTEAGERVLFAATSARFPAKAAHAAEDGGVVEKGSDGRVGSGVYLVNGDSSVVPGNKQLQALRADDVGPKVYEHTMEEFERIAKG